MAERIRKVAIVGGGITGLSAAYHLQEQTRVLGVPLDLTIIEASHRLGGKIQTVEKDGYTIDRGPDSFLAGHEHMVQLAEKLGIRDQLLHSRKDEVYVAIEDEWYPVPKESILGVPTKMMPFMASGLLSWSGKIRAAADLFMPKSFSGSDQPLGQFIRRRFGKEMAENLVEPLVADITSSDLSRLSLEATLPQFLEMEQQHSSIIRGLKQQRRFFTADDGTQGEQAGNFQTFNGGLETLVKALVSQLDGVKLLKSVKVTGIEQTGEQAVLHLNNDSSFEADEVLFAVPHEMLQPIFEPHGLLKEFKDFPSTSVATVFMGFEEGQLEVPVKGTDFIVSRNSDFAVSSATWMHLKWPAMAPPGKMLLRATVGRAGDEAVVDLSDHELEKLVLEDIRRRSKVEGNPEFTLVTRWKEAMPQYIVGHKERILQARNELAASFPMVHLAGSSFEGHRMAHCIAQGEAAARNLTARLTTDKVMGEDQ